MPEIQTKQKITKVAVDNLPKQDKEYFIWDTIIAGFGVRVSPLGRKTYFFQWRTRECTTRRMKIGVHGSVTAEEAREQAKKLALKTALGEKIEPRFRKQSMIGTPATTVEELAREYLAKHAVKKRLNGQKQDRQVLEKYLLPRFGKCPINELNRFDVATFHSKYSHAPIQANRMLALLSKMFTLAISWGWVTHNPIKGIQRYPENKRHRWLDEREFNKLQAVLLRREDIISSFVLQLILATGSRKGEALNATWDQFDLERAVWSKPSEMTKQKKFEHVPLSSAALDILERLKKKHPSESKYLFPSPMSPGKPLQEIKRFWQSVLKEAGIEDFRIHDLRHTYASHLVSQGVSLSVVGKLLGHSLPTTTQRYAHLADAPLREATELIANIINKNKKGPKK